MFGKGLVGINMKIYLTKPHKNDKKIGKKRTKTESIKDRINDS
jgi:hypothetical protein